MSKSRKYKSDFGGLIDTNPTIEDNKKLAKSSENDKRRSKDDQTRIHRSEKDDKYNERESSKSKTRSSKSKYDDNEDEIKLKSSSSSKDKKSNRNKEDDYYQESKKSSSKSKSSKYEDENEIYNLKENKENKKSKSKSNRYDDDEDDYYKEKKESKKISSSNKSSKKSSKYDDYEDEDEYKKERRKHKEKENEKKYYKDSDNEEIDSKKNNQEPDYDDYEDDFENDFENDSELDLDNEKSKKVDYESKRKESYSNSRTEKYKDNSDKEDEYKSKKKEKTSKKIDYDDYDDYKYSNERKDRVVKANTLVKIPTDLVECYSSKIYYNHDSKDRQIRRAKDLFKNIIELDKKSFSLLDINPTEMRTVYSSNLRHEKIQTNDDIYEIEVQTDDIDYSTKWTQYPPDDSKGVGSDDNKQYEQYENANDILQKFRTDFNLIDLKLFLDKSSKVIEELLKKNNEFDKKNLLIEKKTDLEISQGFTRFNLTKDLSKLLKHFQLTNCTFCQDDSNYILCSYNLKDTSNKENTLNNSSLLIVWNIYDTSKSYRVLTCETVTNCLNYTSFIVFSGNIDGSIVLWDLREPYSLHSRNLKLKNVNESNVLRSPTYTTAGVLLNENHMSEVRSVISLQSQTKENDKGVFMQLATLEIDCKLIIWTVVEIKNTDLTVFETDLGLLPGGKIKLVKSSQIQLNNIIRTMYGKTQFQTLNMTKPTNQMNHFFISTNIGRIIHINRKGADFSSSVMKSNYSDGMLYVTDVSFHHEISDILLAGYGNGEIRLYHTGYVTPIKTWNLACLGNKIKEIKWITSRSSCFSVLDEFDNFYVWDLLVEDTQPVIVKQINDFGAISYSSLNNKENLNEKLNDEYLNAPFAYYTNGSKEFEVHLFAPDWTKKSEKETKKFNKLIKNYLLTF